MTSTPQRLDEEIARLIQQRARCVAGREAALKGASQLLHLSQSFPACQVDARALDQAASGAAGLDAGFERTLRELGQEMATLFQEWNTLELTRQEAGRRKRQSERTIEEHRRQIRELESQHFVLILIGMGLLVLVVLLVLAGCNL